VFSRWAMAEVFDDGETDIPLLMIKGGISRTASRPTTPEQDRILDFMRDAVRETCDA
jgi:hypothetical protein